MSNDRGQPREALTVATGFLGRARRLIGGRRSLVAHSIIPIEVPVLTETKRLWAGGQRAEAIRLAYLTALSDVQRAFHVRFSPTWTHEEIQIHGMTPEMGRLPEFFLHLYHLYEPVRYGDLVHPEESPVDLLQSIYAHAEMWQLYAPGLLARPPRQALPPFEEPAASPPSGAM